MRNHASSLLVPLLILCASATVCQAQPAAKADAYPVKPVRMILGFPAGGSVDIAARIIGPRLSERLGQQVIVDNRPGSTGNIAAELAAKAAPDGYTLYMATSVNAVSMSLFKSLPYHPVKDFDPVSLCVTTSYMLVVNPGVPAKSVQELVALAKAKPGTLNYATTGNGSPAHLSAELLKLMAGINLVHVPYKGGPQATTDLLGGQVQLTFSNIPSVLPHVKSEKLRALAVTSAQRTPLAPNLPTVAESGYPGFEVLSWYGVMAPKGTPKPVIDRLNAELVGVLALADVKEQLSVQGLEAASNSPQQFAAFFDSEIGKYAKLIKEANIHAD
ncbi:MAG: tripartite tricarboxylate transporter substrate binding protein [Betaproteobacteria bacterium]|nr:tripartite tricarboxylate transporter substrate binding protein [Betaproteobacteria bacterium]